VRPHNANRLSMYHPFGQNCSGKLSWIPALRCRTCTRSSGVTQTNENKEETEHQINSNQNSIDPNNPFNSYNTSNNRYNNNHHKNHNNAHNHNDNYNYMEESSDYNSNEIYEDIKPMDNKSITSLRTNKSYLNKSFSKKEEYPK